MSTKKQVAFKYTDKQGKTVLVETSVRPYDDAVPLHEGPVIREWVGLKEEEIKECFKITPDCHLTWHIYKRIEDKLKEKNT